MARPGWPERNRAARSFRQLRRFHHVINSDKVFGTHNRLVRPLRLLQTKVARQPEGRRPKEVMMPLKDSSVSEMRTLMTGLMFGESPRWHDGRFWVSDWVAHEVIAVDLEGKSEVVVREPSIPLCFDFLPDGRLVIMSGRRILRLEPDGSLATHADLTGLSELGWNEIVVDAAVTPMSTPRAS